MSDREPSFSENRLSWNAAIRRHNEHKGHLQQALADSHPFLPSEVLSRLGGGWPLLLQPFCNDGREIIALSTRFERCIGVDYSVAAIDFARDLARNYPSCDFVCAEVTEWLANNNAPVASTIFTSLGSLWWIPDLATYLERLRAASLPYSRYIMWEFHPYLSMLNASLQVDDSYPFSELAIRFETGIVDYVADPSSCLLGVRDPGPHSDFVNPHPVTEYRRGIASIVTMATEAGWRVCELVELPYIYGERYNKGLVDVGEGNFGFPPGTHQLPLTFILVLSNDPLK